MGMLDSSREPARASWYVLLDLRRELHLLNGNTGLFPQAMWTSSSVINVFLYVRDWCSVDVIGGESFLVANIERYAVIFSVV